MEGILPSHSFGSQVWGAESTKQGSVYQTLPLFLVLLKLEATSTTDIDIQKDHQQLKMELDQIGRAHV